MQRRYLWGIFLISVLLGTSFYITIADCTPDNDPGDNVVTCDDAPLDPGRTDRADGGAGNDTIIIGSNSATNDVYGDNADGNGGNDTIVVDGLANGNVYGDQVTGNGGNDTIIINSQSESILGDMADGDGGADTIIVNGTVNGLILGDYTEGDGGDDVIINNGTVSNSVAGDSSSGDGGNDVIINNGVIEQDIRGDYSTGNGGDDVIINNGTVESFILGDNTGDTGDGGNDLIVNNGTALYITGDAVGGNGGDDTIINNGLVMGDLNGDVAQGVGGDDTIINSGTVLGMIYGEDGNDTIIIHVDTSNGGDDGELAIDGGAGNDRLIFAQLVCAEDGVQNDIAGQLAGLNGDTGSHSITINGQTYMWQYIEELIGLLRQHNCIVGFADGRLNAYDAAAPVVAYCVSDGGLVLYDINAESQGRLTLNINAETLKASLDAAMKTNQSVLVASDDAGNSIWALPTGEYQLVGANDVEPDKTYFFTFAADRCPTQH